MGIAAERKPDAETLVYEERIQALKCFTANDMKKSGKWLTHWPCSLQANMIVFIQHIKEIEQA